MRDYTPDPRLYEMMTILSPDVSEDDLPAQIETIAGYITTAGGTVNETLRESPWGRRRLAYSIRHTGRDIRDGFYTVFHFTLDPGGVRDIERDLKLNDQVMRFLITHYTPKPEVPGAPTAVGDEVSAEGEAPTTADAAVADSGAPAEATSETEPATEPASGTADNATEDSTAETAPEAESAVEDEVAVAEAEVPVEEVAEVAAPAEASDAEAESAATEPAEPIEDAATSEAPAEEPVAEEPVAEEPVAEEPVADELAAVEPVADEPASEDLASEETPAEPTAPAKDDEEA